MHIQFCEGEESSADGAPGALPSHLASREAGSVMSLTRPSARAGGAAGIGGRRTPRARPLSMALPEATAANDFTASPRHERTNTISHDGSAKERQRQNDASRGGGRGGGRGRGAGDGSDWMRGRGGRNRSGRLAPAGAGAGAGAERVSQDVLASYEMHSILNDGGRAAVTRLPLCAPSPFPPLALPLLSPFSVGLSLFSLALSRSLSLSFSFFFARARFLSLFLSLSLSLSIPLWWWGGYGRGHDAVRVRTCAGPHPPATQEPPARPTATPGRIARTNKDAGPPPPDRR